MNSGRCEYEWSLLNSLGPRANRQYRLWHQIIEADYHPLSTFQLMYSV